MSKTLIHLRNRMLRFDNAIIVLHILNAELRFMMIPIPHTCLAVLNEFLLCKLEIWYKTINPAFHFKTDQISTSFSHVIEL